MYTGLFGIPVQVNLIKSHLFSRSIFSFFHRNVAHDGENVIRIRITFAALNSESLETGEIKEKKHGSISLSFLHYSKIRNTPTPVNLSS